MINISQIGVGYWGPNLLRNIFSNKRCVVPKVAELSPDRREYVKETYPSIEVVDDPDDIINDDNIEAVVIATPVATHFDLAVKALKSGKHVLVEKPIATNLDEVEQIRKLSNERGRVAMVGHTFLFNDAVRYIKHLIESGEIGQIRYIYSQRLNLGRIRSDVDALWNLGPHDISIIQYWLGDPEPIHVTKTGVDYIQEGIADVVFMNILYPNKIMANIHVSWLDPRKVRRMILVGSKRMVVYDDTNENKVAIYDKGIDRMAILGENMDYDNQNFKSYNHRSGDVLFPKIDFKEPLKVEVDHFIDCIQNGDECITGIDHAKKVVEILTR